MEASRYLSNLILAVLICSSGSTVLAQGRWNGGETTNLFKYGNPVTEEQTNFDNFITNFPLCVMNAHEIDILEITYVGKIKNNQQARELIRHNIHHDAPAWGISVADIGTKDGGWKKSVVRLRTNARIDTAKINIPEIIDTLADYFVHTGDAVYAIKIVSPELQTFDYYVFINSKTKQVTTKGNMLAFDIPVGYIREKTKNSY